MFTIGAEMMTHVDLLTTVTPTANQAWPMYAGFIGVAAASILFGSNLIPVKKFETGDGMYIITVSYTHLTLPTNREV